MIILLTYLEQAFYLILRVCVVEVKVIQEAETD